MTVGNSSDIYRKDHLRSTSGKKDGRRVVLVITSNEAKKQEFQATLGDKYGCNVVFAKADDHPLLCQAASLENNTTSSSAHLSCASEQVVDAVKKIVADWDHPDAGSPQFILREECRLRDLKTNKFLENDAREFIEKSPEKAPKFLSDESFLAVWALRWNNTDGKLLDVDARWFHQANEGYLDPARRSAEASFGWDHLFVIPRLNKSYDEMKQLGLGKIASRQLTLSSFIFKYLLYDRPKGLTHNTELKQPASAIEFTPEMSVARFLKSNPYTSNPNLKKWKLDKFQVHVLNSGIFFKAAASRPMGNFFSPPIAGVPLTSKKDAVEETVFLTHDVGHQHVPDLIYEGQDLDSLPPKQAKEILNVYCIWRMMSEGTTMVLADMIYADTLAATSDDYVKCLDTRIYPLFRATIKKASNEDKNSLCQTLKHLLWANICFALVGDASPWEGLVEDGKEAALVAFKNHFEKFFIGDHIWTLKNFRGMTDNHALYKMWAEDIVTPEQFSRAGLPRITEVVDILKKERNVPEALVSGPMNKELVYAVFEYLFDSRIEPIFGVDATTKPEEVELPEQQRLTNAFRRYIIGQSYFYARFAPALPDLKERGKKLMASFLDAEKATGIVDATKREEIQQQFSRDVRYVWSMGLIPAVEAECYLQIHPIFEPCFIDYYQLQYTTVADTVAAIHPGA